MGTKPTIDWWGGKKMAYKYIKDSGKLYRYKGKKYRGGAKPFASLEFRTPMGKWAPVRNYALKSRLARK